MFVIKGFILCNLWNIYNYRRFKLSFTLLRNFWLRCLLWHLSPLWFTLSDMWQVFGHLNPLFFLEISRECAIKVLLLYDYQTLCWHWTLQRARFIYYEHWIVAGIVTVQLFSNSLCQVRVCKLAQVIDVRLFTTLVYNAHLGFNLRQIHLLSVMKLEPLGISFQNTCFHQYWVVIKLLQRLPFGILSVRCLSLHLRRCFTLVFQL